MTPSIPDTLLQALEPFLGGPIQNATAVGGGCIAHATRLETDTDAFFLKWGAGEVGATFVAEAAGLRALRAVDSPLVVPEVVAVAAPASDRPGFLLLEWLRSGRRRRDYWDRFAEGLATLHRADREQYGFEADNYIGRLPQVNSWLPRWPDFFRTCRLLPQVRRARSDGRWERSWDDRIEFIVRRLDLWLPDQPPASMLHGDLWSGNVMCIDTGTAALIDPAAYYGHREADLAMAELFGGFAPRFFEAYREVWPLEPGYDRRRDLYNLYHLINHLNHFGSGYTGSVDRILRRYG